MKNPLLKKSIAFTGLLLLSLGINAFQTKGVIFAINSKYINVSDIEMPLSPTVNVVGLDNMPKTLLSLRRGDKVGIKTMQINNKVFVKSIHLLQELNSNENTER